DWSVTGVQTCALPIWSIMIQNAAPPDLLSIGFTAEASYQRSEVAEQAWRKAADSGHPDSAAEAAVGLGNLLREQGDTEGARAAYQQAIDSGQEVYASVAAVNLGNLLREQGD